MMESELATEERRYKTELVTPVSNTREGANKIE